jgi:hypothetical protein
MKTKLPTIKELAALVRAVKVGIEDEYRAFDGEDIPGTQLTIGWSPEDGDWDFQTGDNSYTGAAYPYPIWAVQGVYRRSNSREVARDLIAELEEQAWQFEDEA